jgi:D-alanyl-D-alanine carboxypeptidase
MENNMTNGNLKQPHQPFDPTVRSEVLADRLDALLGQMAAPKTIHNALFAVEKMDGSFNWVGAIGDAHPCGALLHTDTPIYIASVTKLFIASTILKLHERNLIDLDQPILAYLPQALIAGLHRMNGVDYTDQITVRHLLGHSSGLPEYLEDKPKGGRTFVDRILEQDFAFTIEDILDVVREPAPTLPTATVSRTKKEGALLRYQLPAADRDH